MKKKGLTNDKINQSLQEQGYEPKQIEDALTQANIKQGVGNPNSPSFQTPEESQQNIVKNVVQQKPQQSAQLNVAPDMSNIPQDYEGSALDENIPIPSPPEEEKEPAFTGFAQPTQPQQMPYQATSEELVEAIIDEKWQQLVSNIGDIELWKARVNDDLEAIKQEVLRINEKFELLQSSMLGKVSEYSQSLSTVNVELKALEQVMQKIIEPLTTNIKELTNITEELKKRSAIYP